MQETIKKLRESLGKDAEYVTNERLALFLAIVRGQQMEALAMARGYVKTMKELNQIVNDDEV